MDEQTAARFDGRRGGRTSRPVSPCTNRTTVGRSATAFTLWDLLLSGM